MEKHAVRVLIAISSMMVILVGYQNCGMHAYSTSGGSSSFSSNSCKLPSGKVAAVEDVLRPSVFEKAGDKTLLNLESDESVNQVSLLYNHVCDLKRTPYEASQLDQNPLTSKAREDRALHPELNLEEKAEFSHQVEFSSEIKMLEIQRYAHDDLCIIGVGPVSRFKPSALYNPSDTNFPQQKHHVLIKSQTGWDHFYDPTNGIKQDVVVAVIDTGVNYTNPDLTNQMWHHTTTGKMGYDFADQDDDPMDGGVRCDASGNVMKDAAGNPVPEQHGTHVSGLIAADMNNAKVVGVAPLHVKIMALKVASSRAGQECLGMRNTDIEQAIQYAIDNGADVINMSLGFAYDGPGDPTPTLKQKIQSAIARGIVVVVAAGNDSFVFTSTHRDYPAGYAQELNGMLSVASLDAENGRLSYFSNYSNFYIEMGTPGNQSNNGIGLSCGMNCPIGLISTVQGSSIDAMAGTSMASPVTAGAAALAIGYGKALGRGYNPQLIEQALEASATKSASLVSTVKDGNQLNLERLALYIEGNLPGPTPTPTPPGPGPSPSPRPSGTPSPSATPIPSATPRPSPTPIPPCPVQ